MSYVLLHFRIRHDERPPHRVPTIREFIDRDEAIEECFNLILEAESSGLRDEDIEKIVSGSDIIKGHLRRGGSIWVWEWEKKGNGDLFYVSPAAETLKSPSETVDFLTKLGLFDGGCDCEPLIDASVEVSDLINLD